MADMAGLIPINEARRRALAAVAPLAAEDVSLEDALGRVLAENVTSSIDVPPFDPSAMDGYAVIAGPAAELRVVDESRAGRPATARLEPGTAIRISTGAMVPEGATAVVPVENVTVARGDEAVPEASPASEGPWPDAPPAGESHVVRVPDTEPGANVRHRGEDVRAGDPVATAGTVLGPAAIGSLASVGAGSVRCARRPRVALLVTGDELTTPGEPLAPGGIYSSNGYALGAQVEAAGAVLASRTTVRDSAEDTRASLERALASADVVVVSGGVSVGPHDHVKGALADLGVEEHFWGVALQPGKPTWFGVRGTHVAATAAPGTSDGVLVFGLPGNPVSAMVTFALFVRPVLTALQGGDPSTMRTTATLDAEVPRRPNRDQAVRVTLSLTPDGWRAAPTGPQGSHILSSLTKADALALVLAGPEPAPVGETVEIEPL
jgi:molybdopterin molybdotransferase